MSALLEASSRLATAWTRLYTRGLPAPVRDRRLGEIRSDLHDHRADGAVDGRSQSDVGFEVLVRVLAGVPADLSWRWSTAHGARRAVIVPGRKVRTVATKLFVALGVVLTALVGAYMVWNGVGLVTGGARGVSPMWGAIEIGSGLAMLVGLAVASRRPGIGATVLIVGVVTIAVTHVWLLAINVPVAVLLIAAAIVRARRVTTRNAAAV